MNPYFSVNQANEILPTVIKKFDYAKKMKVEVMKMEQQLTSGLTSTTSLEEPTLAVPVPLFTVTLTIVMRRYYDF